MTKSQKNILWFKEISSKDISLVGGKNASLGEMYTKLSQKGINIPDGFTLTSKAYWYFLEKNKINQRLKEIFRKFNPRSLKSLQGTGREARKLILEADFPEDLIKEILKAYQKLSRKYGEENLDVAVRSSGTCEDIPEASFAGQFETFLNISGEENLLRAIKKSFASLFNDRAIAYKEEKGFSHLKIALSVGIQKMIRSDLASSGVIFTLDTETGFQNVVLINSIFGLGEMIVKGKVTPDEFFVFKPLLGKENYKPIIVKNLGRKSKKYIYNRKGGLKEVKVSEDKQLKFSLTDDEILTLAQWACLIEEHYKLAQDIEWAKDGKTKELFILQSRPETVHSLKEKKFFEEYKIKTKELPILRGIAIGDKIGFGKVRLIPDVSKILQFKKGEVLVTKMTDPDWCPVLRLASGVVTDEGGKTCFSGKTKVLTNKGFITLSELYQKLKFNSNDVKTLSFNTKNNKITWRSILQVHKRKVKTWKTLVSPNLRSEQNFLEVTPDHEFLTLNNRKLIKEKVSSIISNNKGVLTSQFIPRWSNHNFNPKESYLLGALFSDGSAFVSNQGSYIVAFSQKLNRKKKRFIDAVNLYFKEIYNKSLRLLGAKTENTQGNFVCGSKEVYSKIVKRKETLISDFLCADEENLLAFLSGILDGDGNVSDHQIQITVGKKEMLEAIVIASLRLGLVPTVCKRKNWWVVSFDRKFSTQLLKLTKRLKGNFLNSKQEHFKKFVSPQVIGDIIDLINQRGRMKHDYLVKNNTITDYKIRKAIFPKISHALKKEFEKILESPFSMQKIKLLNKRKTKQDVYNLTLEANNELDHNYIVFTKNYTPVIVGNCHAAIVSRELGIPCIVGSQKATKILKTGQPVTIDCTQGLKGRIFKGKVLFEIKRFDLEKIPKLKTKVMINIGAPEIAFKTSFLANDGVGLVREEFIIAEKIKVHPLALYHFKKIKNKALKKKIEKITVEHKDKKEYFIKELAEGIGQIAAAFYPKEVIVRFSDFKTNEYAQLIGGEIFEPKETNPMLGWRGASRYYDENFKPAFLMECQAIKRVRDVFGLKNVKVMIPFCRTVEEGKKVLELMKKVGLKKGRDGLKVYVMCEVPSNVILAEEFLKIFDGMSIGSNDLTQLALGIDRDNAYLQKIGDERNAVVKEMIKKIIQLCREKKKYCGICGQAPSDYPEFAEFLVKEGIESMSLNPDTVIKTILRLSKK